MCDHSEVDALREAVKKRDQYIAELEQTLDFMLYQFYGNSEPLRFDAAEKYVVKVRKDKP
jgi:hypothetical protein